MAIKSLTVNTDRSVTLVTDTGEILGMSSALAGVFREQILKHDLRDAIRYKCEDLDGDLIALGSLDMTPDEFIGEVFDMLEDGIEYGDFPSEEYIEETILDTANTYGIMIDE